MLASPPCDYPQTKKRSLGSDAESLYWIKRTKHSHPYSSTAAPIILPTLHTIAPPALTPKQQEPSHMRVRDPALPSHTWDARPMDDSTKEDPMMIDKSVFSERIDDLESCLNENEHCERNEPTLDLYGLLHQQQRPLKATMINGVLLPMEQKQGESKYSIPDFVLRSSGSKPNSTKTMAIMQQNIDTSVDLMDID
ncbi:hypothetical protein [Absidia glauca]|uniref:Uncharacterized protein n=1 Tax=Absidia glauca TaxID=4829 RepID=A0A168N4W6_ABSGL|nr:hypothetical protein [Absidia glauca]